MATELFDFAIQFLMECETSKQWTKQGWRDFKRTCGYTGPGIVIVLKLFAMYRIVDEAALVAYLLSVHKTRRHLIDSVNESIGNLLDLADECPVSGVAFGVNGLLRAEAEDRSMKTDLGPRVKPFEAGDLAEEGGVYLLSFSGRDHKCETFHHAAVVTYPEADPRAGGVCFVIDSWFQTATVCRPLTARRFSYVDLIRALSIINSDELTLEAACTIFLDFFGAPPNIDDFFGRRYGLPVVNVVNSFYINQLFFECDRLIASGEQTSSHFG